MPSPRISCCRFRTTKWFTASARCWARCRATSGSSSPTCARFWPTCMAHPGKKLLFMGREIGAWRGVEPRWRPAMGAAAVRLSSQAAGLVRELNRIYRAQPGASIEVDFHYTGFEWVDFRRCGEFRHLVSARAPTIAKDLSAVRLQLHAGAALGLSSRRAGGGLLSGDFEYRFGAVRRQQHGQRRVRRVPAGFPQQALHSLSITLPPLAVVVVRIARLSMSEPCAEYDFAGCPRTADLLCFHAARHGAPDGGPMKIWATDSWFPL